MQADRFREASRNFYLEKSCTYGAGVCSNCGKILGYNSNEQDFIWSGGEECPNCHRGISVCHW